jgi:radical SAM superfamily enzyme YgiQ (UPF0313 family)
MTCIACINPERQEKIKQALNICAKDHGFIVWSFHSLDIYEWMHTLENRIRTHIENRRFQSVSRVMIVGAPQVGDQAKAIHRVCPHAQAVYVGPNIKTPHPNHATRNIANAIKELAATKHRCEYLEPLAPIDFIVQRAMTEMKYTVTAPQQITVRNPLSTASRELVPA